MSDSSQNNHHNNDGDGGKDEGGSVVIDLTPLNEKMASQHYHYHHRYFLERLGLTADEVDWPSNSSTKSTNTALAVKGVVNVGDVRDVGGSSVFSSASSWRARDALTSILGSNVCMVKSDTGLTAVELAILENETGEEGAGGRSSSPTLSSSSPSSPMVSIDSFLPSLLLPKNIRNSNSQAYTDKNGSEDWAQSSRLAINVDYVRRAFDAAAFAILRGEDRFRHRSQMQDNSLTSSATMDTGINTLTAKISKKPPTPEDRIGGLRYDPPLLIAMEAIRRARITSLNHSSSGNCKSVAQFLKKNNTIPWFHVPLVVGGGGTAAKKTSSSLAIAGISPSDDVRDTSSTAVNNEAVCAASGKSLIISEVDNSKVVKKPLEGEKMSKKRGREGKDASSKRRKKQAPDSNSTSVSTVKEKKNNVVVTGSAKKEDKAKKQKSSTPTPSSSSSSIKHSSLNNVQKAKKSPRSPSSVSEEAAAGIVDHPAITRSIVCGAAMRLFQELNPKVDMNTETDDDSAYTAAIQEQISEIIRSDHIMGSISGKEMSDESPKKLLHPSSTKNKANDKRIGLGNVNTDEITARAITLGNRALNQSRGAAWRCDQRRKFRMDSALSKVGAVSSIVCDNDETLSRLRDETPRWPTNPFLVTPAHTLPLLIPNSFAAVSDDESTDFEGRESKYNQGSINQDPSSHVPSKNLSDDAEWKSCLPRMLEILNKGTGHAIFHDMQWTDRAFRVANMLQTMASSLYASAPTCQSSSNQSSTIARKAYSNYGPHLIVTSNGEDFDKFSAVFGRLGDGLHRSIFKKGGRNNSFAHDPGDVDNLLRVLPYHGSKVQRRQLRKHFGSIAPSSDSHFSFLGGLPDSHFHVILTTYSNLLEDFAHFCQIPFQVVLLDDGMSWLGSSYSDPNGDIAMLWNTGLWSKFDFGLGKTGVTNDGGKRLMSWDFSKDIAGLEADDDNPEVSVSNGALGERTSSGRFPMGLTARHRILLASNMHAQCRGQVYKAPVLGLLTFLAPQFAETIMDDWERSRVTRCMQTMSCLRTVLARLLVVYSGDSTCRSPNDLIALSLRALQGELPLRSFSLPPPPPRQNVVMVETCSVGEEDEVTEKTKHLEKFANLRKNESAWFLPYSSMYNEIRFMLPKPILAGVKKTNAAGYGYVCEEIVTASSCTIAGSCGAIVGLSAYRAAVRCGRCFSSELGLKQHILSSHAHSGSWLCRSCGGDCGTSQARTHHERSCRVPRTFCLQSSVVNDGATGAGRGGKQPSKHEVFDKSENQPVGNSQGITRVAGYTGVWVLANGKYVVKVNGELIDKESDVNTPLLFDTAEAAAKKFDQVVTESGTRPRPRLNYRPDGSRIVSADGIKSEDYLDETVKGDPVDGKTTIVAPDLSVIDIKKLPPQVKPLLRDPNFTSRTGGNSKRYVYAYRGVCRQQRKGHDRWQSQISFNGQNHYLGTFDSEWDAAAVYAWAHLILYGEEATKRAQLEGEAAAAAFEQTEKDIAAGKILPPSLKPAAKKKRGAPKKIKVDTTAAEVRGNCDANTKREGAPAKTMKKELTKTITDMPPKVKVIAKTATPTSTSVHGKKKRPVSSKEWSKLKTECAMMLSSGTKGTSKASILATRKDIADMNEKLLLQNVSGFISGSVTSVSKVFLDTIQDFDMKYQQLPECTPMPMRPCLVGLQSSNFGWDINKFMILCHDDSRTNAAHLSVKINSEFGIAGANGSFFAFVLSSCFTLGRASHTSCDALLSNNNYRIDSTLGMPVRNLDCDVGGPDLSCSEMAAKIQYMPTKSGNFQFIATNDDDIITLNGQRINATKGPHPLRDRDICSVGARVFVFIEKIPFH